MHEHLWKSYYLLNLFFRLVVARFFLNDIARHLSDSIMLAILQQRS
jgi:hypothetical protein